MHVTINKISSFFQVYEENGFISFRFDSTIPNTVCQITNKKVSCRELNYLDFLDYNINHKNVQNKH